MLLTRRQSKITEPGTPTYAIRSLRFVRLALKPLATVLQVPMPTRHNLANKFKSQQFKSGCNQARLLNTNTRTHGAGERYLLQVYPFGGRWFSLVQRINQRQQVFTQCFRRERSAPDGALHDTVLVGAILHRS